MWVFDGERWIEEGSARNDRTSTPAPELGFEEFVPELQIVEVVPVPRKRDDIPPYFPVP